MIKVKKIIALVLTVFMCLSMVACSEGPSKEVTTPPPASNGDSKEGTTTPPATNGDSKETVEFPEFITIGGGSTGGVFFSAAAGIGQLISTNTNSKATAQTTTGGGQNIMLMAKGEMEMGIADNMVVQQAYKGEATFEGDNKNDQIRAVCAIYPAYFQQMVRADSGIKTMRDMIGKTMIVGGPGSGTEIATNKVYAAHDIDYTNRDDIKPEYLGVSSGVEKVQNQQASGISSISPPPFSSFVELVMSADGVLVSLDDEAIEKLTSGDSPYNEGIIPAGTYENQTEDVKTVYMSTLLIADADMSDDVVYEITKLIFENKDYLIKQHNCFNNLDLETAAKNITIPLHPGAERYYREKGVLQ